MDSKNVLLPTKPEVMDKSLTRVVWDAPLEETAKIYEDIGINELDKNVDDIREKESQKRVNNLTTPENQHQTPTKKNSTDTKHACKCKLFQNHPHGNEIDCFESLSDEIMLSVLRWLPQHQLARCAAVSKRWNRLCMDDYLWRTVDFSERKFCSGSLGRVLKPVSVAAKLARSTIHGPLMIPRGDEYHKCVGDFTLQYLDLSMCNTDPDTLTGIIECCPRLRKLSLESCVVNEECLLRIGFIQQLEELNLCMCQEVDGKTLCYAISELPGLRKLSLESCVVNQECLLRMSSFQQHEEPNLCMCPEVEGKSLCYAISELPGVKALNLGWLNLSKDEVSVLITALPQVLEKLNLSGCRSSLLDEATSLSNLGKVVDKQQRMSESTTNLLRDFTFKETMAENLASQHVENLMTRCPSLTELDLSDANSLTGNVFESLELLPSLQHLALSRCYKIPDPSQLAECLRRLRSLRAVELFGLVTEHNLKALCKMVSPVHINTHPFCSIARPTMSFTKRRYVWEVYCRP